MADHPCRTTSHLRPGWAWRRSINHHRLSADKTLPMLAGLTRMSTYQLSNVLYGRRRLLADELLDLAEALNIDPWALLGRPHPTATTGTPCPPPRT
jgi:uncharacterized membrane protein